MKTKTTKKSLKYIVVLTIQALLFLQATAQTETLPTGSFIINMGATNPNTIANGLKPYGLLYDLIRNNNVPIKWVIGAGKIKDGVDFTYNGVQYRGGTFIIPAQYRSAAVNAKIASWQAQGVVGTTTISPMTVAVTQTLKSAPKWTLDATNGAISEGYLINAGITNNVFPGAYDWKSPQLLGACDDFFVMPHADPTWATHSNLFFWNQNSLGSIWAACHAVSALENCINPANPAQQMNFLSTRTSAVAPVPWPNNSLTLWTAHTTGSVPYTSQFFDDPIAQYMGTADAAFLNGSEQIYLPKQGAAPANTRWRPGVKIISYDPTQANVTAPDLANGNVAAVMLYGKAFDDPGRGYVMYEAGHSHNKGTAADVAAQRAFFNFSFFQVQPKSPSITVTGLAAGQSINGGSVTNVSVTASSPLTAVTFTYLWTSSCGGTFASPTSASTTFTAPAVAGPTPCILTCKVTDNCGRASFESFPVTILSGPQPPVPSPDNATISVTCGTGTPVTVNVLANDTDPGGLPLTLTNVTGAVNGTVSYTAAGNVTFIPDANFTGPLVLTYTACNNASPAPLCANSTLTITSTGGTTPAAANDAYTIAEDAAGRFNVLLNDAAGLTVTGITAGPANGRVSINLDNTITYVPNADYAGTDIFTYRVTNGSGGYNTATVTVSITDDGCNSGTFQTGTTSSNVTLTATEDANIWNNNAADELKNYGACDILYLNGPSGTAKDRQLIRYDLSSIPANATITSATVRLVKIGGANGARDVSIHRLTSNWTEGTGACGGAAGVANWQQRIAGTPWTTAGGDFDATAVATLSVAGNGVYSFTATSLVQGWVNNSFPNHGILTKFTTENLNSEINFAATENATAGNRPQLLVSYTTLNCAAIPVRSPLAMPDSASTANGTAVTFTAAANDYLPVAGAVTYAIVTPPVSGSASIDAAGVINYTPATAFNGVRSLTYRVTHTASGLSDTATVYINITNGRINAVDDAPLPGANSGTAQTIDVKANDTDPEGAVAAAAVTIVTAPLNGTASVDGSNNIVYTPNTGFTGKDTLYYTLCEPAPSCGSSLCDTARLIVTVLNRVPTANPDTKTILPCYSNTITLVTNDTDPENGTLTVTNLSALSNPAAGTLVNNNDGTVTFTPATGFTGVVTFTYTVTDNGVPAQVSAPATVTITVQNPPNTAPVAVNDAENTYMNQVLYASVRDNDSDPENQPLTIPAITLAPLHGTAVVNPANGLVEYTPNPGFYGTDSLRYRICDIPIIIVATCTSGPDLCDTATLVITVDPPFIILPVDFISFNANKVNNTSVLNFEIAQPVQGSVFTIERSTTGAGFIALGSLNSTNATRYSFTDVSPVQNAKNYYRIKETEANGKISYSAIRMVRFIKDAAIEVYPVPASTNINITMNDALLNQPVTITLYNGQGQEVARKYISRANTSEIIDISSLPGGVYQLRIMNNAAVAADKKVVIMK